MDLCVIIGYENTFIGYISNLGPNDGLVYKNYNNIYRKRIVKVDSL
jgi:hypothetical protein